MMCQRQHTRAVSVSRRKAQDIFICRRPSPNAFQNVNWLFEPLNCDTLSPDRLHEDFNWSEFTRSFDEDWSWQRRPSIHDVHQLEIPQQWRALKRSYHSSCLGRVFTISGTGHASVPNVTSTTNAAPRQQKTTDSCSSESFVMIAHNSRGFFFLLIEEASSGVPRDVWIVREITRNCPICV